MSIEKVRAYMRQFNIEDRIIEFSTSSATVELAAQAAGCEPARIAKTLSFKLNDNSCVLWLLVMPRWTMPNTSIFLAARPKCSVPMR